MKLSYIKIILLLSGVLIMGSCKKKLDINYDPDRIPDSNSPIAQLLTSAQVNLGFENGSDLYRYAALIMQHMSGGASQANQTWEYYRYNITGSDQNNVWGSINAATLSDLELIIKQGAASPYYTGIAKILKAYEYGLVVDVWGDVPYTEAQQLTVNTQPHYDDDAIIYPKLITLLTDGITDLNATTSALTPGTNSVIYSSATFATAKALWIKMANTLKLRLLIHYSKKDPAFCVAQITALVNAAGITFLASNADNFQMPFFNVSGQRSSISAFEVSRPNYLFADRSMINLMNSKADPRLPFYFAIFPFSFTPFSVNTSAASSGNTLTFAYTNTIVQGMTVTGGGIPANTIVKSVAHTPTGTPTLTTITLNDDETPGYAIPAVPAATAITFQPVYRGVSGVKPPIAPNNNYSRIHTFLRGTITGGATAPLPYTGTVQPFTYTGDKPQRMISFAEYNFIRAEAALMGAPGTAQQFFTDGITASMQEVGNTPAEITAYLAANGTLAGTNAQKLKQIIEEKYVASFGVSVEPWTDWRRTGYPAISPPANAVIAVVPRTLFYPQSEIDLNPNNPGQKGADLQSRVFWDN
ncbi:MAG: SusD/RagB family nutrient-binding outer membrane lipoprotein [Chitinophagaceae bacterium]